MDTSEFKRKAKRDGALDAMKCPKCGGRLGLVAANSPEWRDRVCIACSTNYGPEPAISLTKNDWDELTKKTVQDVIGDLEKAVAHYTTDARPAVKPPTLRQMRRRRRAELKRRSKAEMRSLSRGQPKLLNREHDGRMFVTLGSGQRIAATLYEEDGEKFIDWKGRDPKLRVRLLSKVTVVEKPTSSAGPR